LKVGPGPGSGCARLEIDAPSTASNASTVICGGRSACGLSLSSPNRPVIVLLRRTSMRTPVTSVVVTVTIAKPTRLDMAPGANEWRTSSRTYVPGATRSVRHEIDKLRTRLAFARRQLRRASDG
jgi:hypothetical protein